MKKNILIILIITIFISCNKTATQQVDPNTLVVNSKWELRKSVGGIAGTITYPIGNGNTIEFYATDSIKNTYSSAGGSVSEIGTFNCTNTNTTGDYYLTKKINFNGSINTQKDSIKLNGNFLIILSSPSSIMVDGGDVYYEKF